MALVCFAGPAAQRKFSPKGWRHVHGEGDRSQAVELLSYMVGDNDVLSAYATYIDLSAQKMVALPNVWAAI